MPGTISSDHVMVDRGGPTAPWGKAVGDIDRDGRPGLVVGGHKGGGLISYENPGWHKHLIVAEGAFSTDHDVANVDKDGRNDLLLDTRWLRNEAGGRWSVYSRVSG